MKLKYNITKDFPVKDVTFVDFTPSITDKKLLDEIIDKLASFVPSDTDYIVAPDARGFIWGSYISSKLDLPLIPVRKSGKLPSNAVSNTYKYDTEYSTTSLDLPLINLKGKKVVFVDDVYATGGTYNACQNLVKKSGGKVIRGIVLYNILIDDNDKIDYLVTPEDIL